MCANFRPATLQQIQAFMGDPIELDRRCADEAFPGSTVPILRIDRGGGLEAEAAMFGLVAPWCKDIPAIKRSLRACYNARSETLSQKRSFSHAYKARQFCVVPITAWFEPSYEDGDKPTRWAIQRADRAPVYAAGLWEDYFDPAYGDCRTSCTLITIPSADHPVLSRFHGDDEKRTICLLAPDEVRPFLASSPSEAPAYFHSIPPELLITSPSPIPRRAR